MHIRDVLSAVELALRLSACNYREYLDLSRDIFQYAQNALVPFGKGKRAILEPLLLAPPHHIEAGCPQPVSRYPREEVVSDLHVQTAVEEVEIRRAGHVHRRPYLPVCEALARSEVDGRLGKVRQDNLRSLCRSAARTARTVELRDAPAREEGW